VPPEVLAELVSAVGPRGEVSLEANPEDVDPTTSPLALSALRDAGVTRLSLGVQSFDPAVRKRLGRAWVAADPRPVVEAALHAGFDSVSVDLIFAAPDQTLAQLDADLDALLDLGVPHVALYGLTIEPDTPFALAHQRGQLSVATDDGWRRMYDRIHERLGAVGYERYELSNLALPGHRCRHNEGYWQDRPYLGLGPSAHSYLPDGTRTHDHPTLSTWLTAADPVMEAEAPEPHARYVDTLVSGLRCLEGVDLARLAARTGRVPDPAALARLVQEGLVAPPTRHLRLTVAGVPVCDAVVAHLADRAVPAGP
jgi:oxygen-independent coproporphyrinogen-3 oxidase